MSFRNYRELAHTLRTCRKCAQQGYPIVSPPIFAGSSRARILVIGQAPGVTEVEAGRPFNAGSGKRLFEWLVAAGFQEATFRAEQYLTAVTKCFPGKATSGSGDRVASRAEQELCRPYLEAEIELVNPQLILPVGRIAINRFFHAKPPLKEVIGIELEQGGRWIIPLPHPSGASRWHQTSGNRRRIELAIEKLRSRRIKLGL